MRSKLVLLLAVVFGLATAALAYLYLDHAKQVLDQTEYVEVVVAARDIPAETIVQQTMVTTKKIPANLKHEKETKDPQDIIGKILLVPITAGESILTNQVYASGDKKQGLAYLVPVGKRAVTIGVDAVSGISGMIRPGDRVDILATVNDNQVDYTIMPLQDIEVLAVGKVMEANPGGNENLLETNTITLAVQYNDAKPLMLASMKGSIQLLLRNPVDHEKGYYGPYKMNDLIKGSAGGNAVGKN